MGFSSAVWLSVHTRDRRWLVGAIVVHILLDLVGFVLPAIWPSLGSATSVVLMIMCLVGGLVNFAWNKKMSFKAKGASGGLPGTAEDRLPGPG